LVTGVCNIRSNEIVTKKNHPEGWFLYSYRKFSLFDFLVTIYGTVAQLLFDAKQLVVLGHTVGTAQ